MEKDVKTNREEFCDESTPDESQTGVTRRGFLAGVGVGTAAVVVAGAGSAGAAPKSKTTEGLTSVKLKINGRVHQLLVEPRWTLLFVLREKLELTGTKVGCERGECGSCTVLIDGRPQYACMMLAVEAEGREVTTLEGLMDGEKLGPVQEAFVKNDAFQCGYCTPGQIVAAEGLLRSNSKPSTEEIRRGMSGNLCRCGAYQNIFKAVKEADELKTGKGGSS